MKLLLDSHLLIWATSDAKRISLAGRKLINDPANELYFSAASIWELAIKSSLKHPSITFDVASLRRTLLANEYNELPVTADHGLEVAALPRIHKDPFDRLLVAQARVEGMTLVTVDRELAKYPASINPV
ncbi:PilT protein-like protein [Candidatus Koribacter versatilis Ellin345]|uniref:PilT protein-like protein n=1 Tax=Koribacter versatilis (strain Ellin345) TaxID=204669 RepID=Q1IT04_KORVE|nr:type II toxin-antitoxin system VapC family toxin [Candidatus Koribacter versatilis]ABF39996.1 PilT protein-like protein [Candidatus Koribacter versatilis Ellin345]